MAQNRKIEYKKRNIKFLADVRGEEGILELGGGVLYKIIESGTDTAKQVMPTSVVTCYYKGRLIDGRVFDDTFANSYPEALRVSELIDGFKAALLKMHIGDHWMVYIPAEAGYGSRGEADIPGNSTLIFEIKLAGIA